MSTKYQELNAKLEALESKYETMRLAALGWGKDVNKLMRWSDQHLKRLEALEAGATCPHIRSSDEGTSYCGLAEQTANSQSTPNPSQIRSSLVERVGHAIRKADEECMADNWAPEARAAILAVAAWMRELGGYPHAWTAQMLEKELDRG